MTPEGRCRRLASEESRRAAPRPACLALLAGSVNAGQSAPTGCAVRQLKASERALRGLLECVETAPRRGTACYRADPCGIRYRAGGRASASRASVLGFRELERSAWCGDPRDQTIAQALPHGHLHVERGQNEAEALRP